MSERYTEMKTDIYMCGIRAAGHEHVDLVVFVFSLAFGEPHGGG